MEPETEQTPRKAPFESPCEPVKLSVQLEAEDYGWAKRRAEDLYGRRGIGLYVRKLIREDRKLASERAGG